MKSIVLHYSFFGVGGVERVMAFQSRLFAGMGVKVALLLDREPAADSLAMLPPGVDVVTLPSGRKAREAAIRREVSSRSAEIFYEHAFQMIMDPRSPAHLDMLFVKDVLGLGYFLHWHSHAATPFSDCADPGLAVTLKTVFAPRVDGMCVLSRASEIYFRSFGLKAAYAPNRIESGSSGDPSPRFGCNVLWVGRFADGKRPFDAIRAFSVFRRGRPEAKLVMVGGGELLEPARRLAHRLGLGDSVEFPGMRLDTGGFYANSSVYLSTSGFEGFSVAFMEAMSYALPVVSCELSYHEPSRDNAGVSNARLGDVEGLAAALDAVTASEEVWRKMSRASLARYRELQSFDQEGFYRDFLSGKIPQSGTAFSVEDARAIEQMMFDAWCEREDRIMSIVRPLRAFVAIGSFFAGVVRIFCRTAGAKAAWRRRRRARKLLDGALEACRRRGKRNES